MPGVPTIPEPIMRFLLAEPWRPFAIMACTATAMSAACFAHFIFGWSPLL